MDINQCYFCSLECFIREHLHIDFRRKDLLGGPNLYSRDPRSYFCFSIFFFSISFLLSFHFWLSDILLLLLCLISSLLPKLYDMTGALGLTMRAEVQVYLIFLLLRLLRPSGFCRADCFLLCLRSLSSSS